MRPILPSLAPDVKARGFLLGGLLTIHIAVWTVATTLVPAGFPAIQLVAERFSTFAIVLMSVNLVLSTRAGLIERGLRGLDKLFVTHRTIGLTVAAMVTTHLLIVPKSVGYVASKPVGYTTAAVLLLAIFIASAPRFPWRRLVPLNYQTWKFSHRFMGVLVAMAVTHSLLAHTYVKSSPLLAGYVYGVAAVGLLAWMYRELLFARMGPFHEFVVEQSHLLGDDTTEVTLTAPTGNLSRTAGQFVFVSFEGGPSREQHPFTISSGAGSDPRFSIKSSGDFTKRLLAGVPAGSAARVEGPYGAFDYRRGGGHQLWLAGGIGITPFLAMAEDVDDDTSVLLVWSVRNRQEAIYEQELSQLSRSKPNFRFRLHPTAEKGHVDIATLELGTPQLRACSVLICGPVAMRQGFVRQLKSLHVPRSQVFFEEFRLR